MDWAKQRNKAGQAKANEWLCVDIASDEQGRCNSVLNRDTFSYFVCGTSSAVMLIWPVETFTLRFQSVNPAFLTAIL